MSKFIDELKAEHKLVLSTLVKVKEIGILSKKGKELLFGVKDALVAHIQKEDEKLYPVLAQEEDQKVKSLVKVFTSDIVKITQQVFDFYDNFDENSRNFSYAIEFGRLTAALKSRIEREEKALYPEYEKIINKQS